MAEHQEIWCQPADQPKRQFLVIFDDPQMDLAVFDNEEEARGRWGMNSDDYRALRILSLRSCHDVEEHQILQLSRLIEMGLARVKGHKVLRREGRRYNVREVCITDAGLSTLSEGRCDG